MTRHRPHSPSAVHQKPRVFISSVMQEFKDDRHAIKHALERIGFEVWLAETEPTMGATPRHVCMEYARTCDVFVGILGKQYGYVIPQEDISPTELEFREARSATQSKMLIYVRDCEPEPRQALFIQEMTDFNSGFFRRPRFQSSEELVSFVCEDVVRLLCSSRTTGGEVTDSSEFVRDVTIPDGTLVSSGQSFLKSWEIKNSGNTPWVGRRLKRIGAPSGPGLIGSSESVPIPNTMPGDHVVISVQMIAPECAGSSTCQWKMVDEHGKLCFPDRYPYGLIVTIHTVER